MTPEQSRQLQEVYEWMQQRKFQQLSYPVDNASRDALRAVVGNGPGTTPLLQSISLSGNAQSINVPAAYQKTVVIIVDGAQYEIPSLT